MRDAMYTRHSAEDLWNTEMIKYYCSLASQLEIISSVLSVKRELLLFFMLPSSSSPIRHMLTERLLCARHFAQC